MFVYVVIVYFKLYIGIVMVVVNNVALIIEQAGEWIFCYFIVKIVIYVQFEKLVVFICNEFCFGVYVEVVVEVFVKVVVRCMVVVSEVNEDIIVLVEVKFFVFLSGR